MTDTRFQPVDAPERETAKEPPKRWRNWYRVNQRFWSTTSLVVRPVGSVYQSPAVWPSREVAEQKAREFRSVDGSEMNRLPDTYLGAFPEGEQPKRQN